MSNTIGNLKPVKTSRGEELHGAMTTLHNHLTLCLVPNAQKTSDLAPDYKVYAIGSMGQETEIGAAWLKIKKKIGDVEFTFLSLTIDDPSFPDKLNITAFKNNQGSWDIVWKRYRPGQAA